MVSFSSLIQLIGLPCCLTECRRQQPKPTSKQTNKYRKQPTNLYMSTENMSASPLLLLDSCLVSAILLLILKSSGLQCSHIHFYLSFVTFLLESQVDNWKQTHTHTCTHPHAHTHQQIQLAKCVPLFSFIFSYKSSFQKIPIFTAHFHLGPPPLQQCMQRFSQFPSPLLLPKLFFVSFNALCATLHCQLTDVRQCL